MTSSERPVSSDQKQRPPQGLHCRVAPLTPSKSVDNDLYKARQGATGLKYFQGRINGQWGEGAPQPNFVQLFRAKFPVPEFPKTFSFKNRNPKIFLQFHLQVGVVSNPLLADWAFPLAYS